MKVYKYNHNKEVIIDSIIWLTFGVSSLVTFTYLILY